MGAESNTKINYQPPLGENSSKKELIEVKGDGNCAPRSVIQALCLEGILQGKKDKVINFLGQLVTQTKKKVEVDYTLSFPLEKYRLFINEYKTCNERSIKAFNDKWFYESSKAPTNLDEVLYYLSACLRNEVMQQNLQKKQEELQKVQKRLHNEPNQQEAEKLKEEQNQLHKQVGELLSEKKLGAYTSAEDFFSYLKQFGIQLYVFILQKIIPGQNPISFSESEIITSRDEAKYEVIFISSLEVSNPKVGNENSISIHIAHHGDVKHYQVLIDSFKQELSPSQDTPLKNVTNALKKIDPPHNSQEVERVNIPMEPIKTESPLPSQKFLRNETPQSNEVKLPNPQTQRVSSPLNNTSDIDLAKHLQIQEIKRLRNGSSSFKKQLIALIQEKGYSDSFKVDFEKLMSKYKSQALQQSFRFFLPKPNDNATESNQSESERDLLRHNPLSTH